jgi:hypothetical protein
MPPWLIGLFAGLAAALIIVAVVVVAALMAYWRAKDD